MKSLYLVCNLLGVNLFNVIGDRIRIIDSLFSVHTLYVKCSQLFVNKCIILCSNQYIKSVNCHRRSYETASHRCSRRRDATDGDGKSRAQGIYLRSIWHVTYRFPCALALLIFPLIYEK